MARNRSVSETFLKHLRPALAWCPLTQVMFLNVIEGAKNSMLSGGSNLPPVRSFAVCNDRACICDQGLDQGGTWKCSFNTVLCWLWIQLKVYMKNCMHGSYHVLSKWAVVQVAHVPYACFEQCVMLHTCMTCVKQAVRAGTCRWMQKVIISY